MRQNNIIKTYFQVFTKFKKNNRVRFLLIAKFAYNIAKNANISHISFKINCRYYFYIFYRKDFNFYLKLKIIEELSFFH